MVAESALQKAPYKLQVMGMGKLVGELAGECADEVDGVTNSRGVV